MNNEKLNSVEVACELANLVSIRKFVKDNLYSEIDENDLNLLILAVDEICANLIIHSNNCNAKAKIKLNLKIERSPEGILFEILDKGKYFDYDQYQEPDMQKVVDEQRKGGIGLILVRRIMDRVEFTRNDKHNICRLFKKLA